MQQYYDGFSHRKTSSAVFKGILVILCYTAFQYGKKQILPDGHSPWKAAVNLLLTLCFLLFLTACLYRDLENSRAVLEEQLKSMQEYLQEERRVQSGIRSMKHDMKNTVSVIMQLAKKIPENQNTELEQYLSELEQSLQELDYRFHTGSAVVDALLNMKYHKTVQQISGLHGIGLSNIKKAAEKYDGAVAWEAADHVFRLSVMLKNKS